MRLSEEHFEYLARRVFVQEYYLGRPSFREEMTEFCERFGTNLNAQRFQDKIEQYHKEKTKV